MSQASAFRPQSYLTLVPLWVLSIASIIVQFVAPFFGSPIGVLLGWLGRRNATHMLQEGRLTEREEKVVRVARWTAGLGFWLGMALMIASFLTIVGLIAQGIDLLSFALSALDWLHGLLSELASGIGTAY